MDGTYGPVAALPRGRSMIRTVAVGLWAAVVAILSTYAAATRRPAAARFLSTSRPSTAWNPQPGPLTVPMIADGRLRGYVVARSSPPAPATSATSRPLTFVTDAAFREIYTNGRVEFDQLPSTTSRDHRRHQGQRQQAPGFDLLKDVLLEESATSPRTR